MAAPGRFLIVGPSWVGDMIMSQTLYKLLRARYPDAGIDVLAPRASLPLVSRMREVSRGIVVNTAHGEFKLRYRWGLGEHLAVNGYTHAIVLPNSWKSALIPFFAGIPVRTGFLGEYRYFLLNDIRLLRPTLMPRMIDRFMALGVPAGAELPAPVFPELMVDDGARDEALARLGLDRCRPILGLCPGAEFGDSKRWPEAHFGALADYAIARGMQVWIFGGPNDRAVASRVAAAVSPDHAAMVHDLSGETTLLEAVDLLGAAAQVVSNDSGLMHVAAAVGVPVAVLYGSTSPVFTPPLSSRAEIFSENLSCSPCFERICPLGHKQCLHQLRPVRVRAVIDRAMERASP